MQRRVSIAEYHGVLSVWPDAGACELLFGDTSLVVLPGVQMRTPLEISIEEISSIEVSGDQKPPLFLSLTPKVPVDRTAVSLRLKNGETAYFSVYEKSRAGVLGMLGPWSRQWGVMLREIVPVYSPHR